MVGRQAGRGPVGGEREVGIAVRADEVKLLQDDGTGVADGVGDLAEMGDDVVGNQVISTG